jgi:hypothetical protein
LLVIPLATLIGIPVRACIQVSWVVVLPHETDVDLVERRLLLDLLFINYVKVLIVVHGRRLTAIVCVVMMPRGRRVVVVHLLLPRLVRFLGEILAEQWRSVIRLEFIHNQLVVVYLMMLLILVWHWILPRKLGVSED